MAVAWCRKSYEMTRIVVLLAYPADMAPSSMRWSAMMSARGPGTFLVLSLRVLVGPRALMPELDARIPWGDVDINDHVGLLACLNIPCTRCSWLQRCMKAQQCCWLTIKHVIAYKMLKPVHGENFHSAPGASGMYEPHLATTIR